MALGEKGQVTIGNAGGVTLTAQIIVREPTRDEWRASELLKEATARHDAKDFDGAVGCLRKAYPLLADSSTSYPIATYVRLPLYLQKARRLKEAEREFEALLTGTHARIARDAKHLRWPSGRGPQRRKERPSTGRCASPTSVKVIQLSGYCLGCSRMRASARR